ncbi:Phosphoglucosamine mutase [Trichinella spiralis]|uniref:Phosphoglucosamine mutase n=1 Tax=Trichinella spiralis TaxID=6334 RepID=A0ABR3KWN9_TRISP
MFCYDSYRERIIHSEPPNSYPKPDRVNASWQKVAFDSWSEHVSPNDGKLTIFVVLPEAKLFCSLDCCPSGALSTIFPLFKTNKEIVVYNYISCNAISAYVIIIEPFSNSCRSGQHGMQCIIHINKICFHTNRALRQLKAKACHQLMLRQSEADQYV